jgi:prepilin-type N-terminal cleavage/methylation domain-containing protein
VKALVHRSFFRFGSIADRSAVGSARAESGHQGLVRPEPPQRSGWVGLRSRGDDEAGFTLAEVLVTIVILGVAVIALVSGLMNAITLSDIHRKGAVEQTLLRNYGASITSAVAATCPQNTTGRTFTAVYTPPTGYTATATDSSGLPYSLSNSPCPAPTTQLTLNTSSLDHRNSATLTIVVVVP